MRAFPVSLAPRLILALTVLVAVIAGVFAYVSVHTQERQLLREMVLGADQLSRSITSATWHTMMADQPAATYQIMETIGEKQGIESIRIFNKEGEVTFSTDPNALDRVDTNAEACYQCHAREVPLERLDMPDRWRIVRQPDGTRKLAMITAIYNEPACSAAACHAHPAERAVLGVLDILLDLAPVEANIAGIRQRAFLMAAIEIVLIGIFIGFFTRRFVGAPIKKLIRGTKEISEMELDSPIDIGTGGELGELATSFDTMRERLRDALAELRTFTHELEEKVEERSEQLLQARQKLIQGDRMASLGQLAASVAHEINNPISGVLNLSALMQRLLTEDGIPPNRVKDFERYLTLVTDETARVGRIVSDLLAFSRRSKPQRGDADLNEIVGHTITLISHKLELGNVQLDLWLDKELPQIRCDRSQMQQVVMNLVMNAAEAVSEGGQVAVRTRLSSDGECVVLEVKDDGPGIPENIQSRIFDPFFTTKEEGKGVGLGLAVVYGIVEAHRGTIEVKSFQGKGTTILTRLPRQIAPETPEPDLQETLQQRFEP